MMPQETELKRQLLKKPTVQVISDVIGDVCAFWCLKKRYNAETDQLIIL